MTNPGARPAAAMLKKKPNTDCAWAQSATPTGPWLTAMAGSMAERRPIGSATASSAQNQLTATQAPSFFFSSSLTCAGLALPRDAFIT